jgi:hypothetical protein
MADARGATVEAIALHLFPARETLSTARPARNPCSGSWAGTTSATQMALSDSKIPGFIFEKHI